MPALAVLETKGEALPPVYVLARGSVGLSEQRARGRILRIGPSSEDSIRNRRSRLTYNVQVRLYEEQMGEDRVWLAEA